MSVAAIGEPAVITGYGLAGVMLLPAADAVSVLAAWDRLPPDAELLLLSRAARAVLADRLAERRVVWVEVPG